MALKRVSIDLYFDVVSPYSWIGLESYRKYERHLQADIKYKPFFLGAVIHNAKNISPAVIDAKRIALKEDLARVGEYWGIKVALPENFVTEAFQHGSLLAQRFLTAVDVKHPELMTLTARALASRIWTTDEPIHRENDLREAAAVVGLPDVEQLVADCHSQSVKALLKQRTDEAIATGAFGGPWAVYKRDGQIFARFFGSDRLPIACHILGLEYKGPNP